MAASFPVPFSWNPSSSEVFFQQTIRAILDHELVFGVSPMMMIAGRTKRKDFRSGSLLLG
jgi:hypothetical protein